MTAVLLVLFDRCYRLRTVSVLTAAFSGVRDLNPPFLLDREIGEPKLRVKSSVLGRKPLQREKPQNSTMLKCCRSATFGLKGLNNFKSLRLLLWSTVVV